MIAALSALTSLLQRKAALVLYAAGMRKLVLSAAGMRKSRAARIARARKAAEVDSGALRCDGAVEQARVGVALVDIVGRGRDGVAVAATGLAQEVVDERHRRRRRRRR